MRVPRAKTKSQVTGDEQLVIVDLLRAHCEMIRFWDGSVPFSGRPRVQINARVILIPL
jgi:hypothetical protein